jgi:hypothetical protein
VMLSAPFAVRAQPTPDESPNAETTSTEQLRQMVEDVDERPNGSQGWPWQAWLWWAGMDSKTRRKMRRRNGGTL